MIERLVSLGNVVIDIVTTIDALPQPGGDVLASSAEVTPGGAFNVLVAAVRQGLPSVYGGAHGDGPFGDLVRAALEREGVGIAIPRVTGMDTGFDVAMVDASGERTFVTAVGAEGELSSERLAGVSLRATDAIHVSGYGMLHPVNRAAILDALDSLPGTVLFDPGPLGHDIPTATLESVLDRCDWWSGNEREAMLATGQEDPIAAASRLSERVRAGAIVRLGSRGCVIARPGHSAETVSGYPVDVVDTNGAGDAHVGAFVASLAAGLSPADAADRANAVAAIAVTRAGPASAPTEAETDEFLR